MSPGEFSSLLSNILNAIYAALCIISVLGGTVVWLISQRFLSKKSFGTILKTKEEDIKALEKRIVLVELQQELSKGPIGNIEQGIKDMREQITKLAAQVTDLDKKIAIHEALQPKKGIPAE